MRKPLTVDGVCRDSGPFPQTIAPVLSYRDDWGVASV